MELKIGKGKGLEQKMRGNTLILPKKGYILAKVYRLLFKQISEIITHIIYSRIGPGVAFIVLLLAIIPDTGVAQAAQIEAPGSVVEADEPAQQQAEPAGVLSRQIEPASFKSVITRDQMDRFADYTVEDAMARVTGMQVNQRGAINLRGAGLNRYNVTLDGQRIGTTGAGDRSFDLGSISADMFRSVEVIKVLTPDMDADALAGSINLVTRRDPGDREIEARFGGGGNTRYFPYTGLGSRASVRYGEALREDLSFAVNLSHQQDQRGRESLQLDYDVADFGDGPVDVIERISPSLFTDASNRTGGGFQLRFQPSDRDSYHIRAMLNNNTREMIRHRENWVANGGWIDFSNTTAHIEQGFTSYDMRFQDVGVQQYAVQGGARHRFDMMELEYSLGWGQSRFNQVDFLFPFKVENLEYSIDMEDRTRPSTQVINYPVQDDGTIIRRRYNLQDINKIVDDHVDNTFSGRIDAEILFALGSFKLGTSARLAYKEGDHSDSDYTFGLGRRNLFNFGRVSARTREVKVLDRTEYRIPWLIDAHDARLFYESNEPLFNRDETVHSLRSDIRNYTVMEQIYSGYAMATLFFWDFTIIGGARVEHAGARNEGGRIILNEAGELEPALPGTQNTANAHLFPSIHLLFPPSTTTNIRLAYSRSIARPDFGRLAPFERTNMQDSIIFRGNPDLEPMISDNLDAIVEQYLGQSGTLSLGLFHKQLSGFVFERQRTVAEGERAGFEERTFDNGDETAAIYGAEVSWQQNLTFLPGFLSNFGIYANYTWSRSAFNVDYRDDEVRLPGQSPHVVNLAVDYSQGRFSTQVSYHWTAEMLAVDGLQSEPGPAPAIGGTGPFYLDRYEDGWTDISASFRLRISSQFHFWADATNLLGGAEQLKYARSPAYPVVTDFRGGQTFNMGLHYRF